jgi:hypothetical protein
MQKLHVGASFAAALRLLRLRSPHGVLQSATIFAGFACFDVEMP